MKLFDMHCDTLYECHCHGTELYENPHHIDLQRGLRYDTWIQIFAVWLPDSLRGKDAFETCCTMLEFAHAQARTYPAALRLVENGEDLRAEEPGRCQGILAVEGGAMLGGDAAHVDDLRRYGVRLLTLTWNGENELGTGCAGEASKGLTPFGREVVRRMGHAGILPDVSHLNERGFWDVAERTEGPFLASHSVSAAVHPHARNLTDAQFCAIRDAGGVVGLNLCGSQLGEQTFAQIERHLDRYLSLGGGQTVALGCDLDGTSLPDDWNGIAVMERLYAYFFSRGYTQDCLERLFFQNAFDFFRNALTSGGKMD